MLIEGATEKNKKLILNSQFINNRHWCANIFYQSIYSVYYFLFNKCANWHTLLLSQISLTWLCLHQFAGFLWRHCLHPKHGHVTYEDRETHASCHSYVLFICLLRRIAMYETESFTQYCQQHIKMPAWNRKDKSCTWLDLEKPVD